MPEINPENYPVDDRPSTFEPFSEELPPSKPKPKQEEDSSEDESKDGDDNQREVAGQTMDNEMPEEELDDTNGDDYEDGSSLDETTDDEEAY